MMGTLPDPLADRAPLPPQPMGAPSVLVDLTGPEPDGPPTIADPIVVVSPVAEEPPARPASLPPVSAPAPAPTAPAAPPALPIAVSEPSPAAAAADSPAPEAKAGKNTMTEEEKRTLSDYVAKVVVTELSPYFKKNVIENKGEFKHIARKVTKEIASREHVRNIDNERTIRKIREFVKAHMKHLQKVKKQTVIPKAASPA
eukprot:EG_transcript_20566